VLDLKWIRQFPELLDQGLQKRGQAPLAAKIIELDLKYREAQTELQTLQNKRNDLAKQIGTCKQKGESAEALMAESQAIKDKTPEIEVAERQLGEALQAILSLIPNLPADSVPVGKDETDNKLVRTVGEPTKLDFKPKFHFEIGEALGQMDFETAAKVAGARFVYLKGSLARLERAIAAFMIDNHTDKFGYQEVSPPLLVRSPAVYGVGQLPKFKEDLFETTDERWLISTSEVPLTNMVMEKTVDEASLPLRYTAFTSCFRSEAGSAGRDTRGMIRLHQFNKVELVSIVHPDKSWEEHERLTGAAEEILKQLKLPYRVMMLCTGDIGPASRKTYDLEVWLPGEDTYREISSCSNCGDYQARRMNARFKPADGGKPQFLHTLNGSGLAVGRTLVAILENYQQADGTVLIPDVLVPYMRGQKVINHEQ
jgi:seryl-tRNA synthetase